MTIEDAQRDLRRAYVGGGPGAFVSGLLWLAAWWVEGTRGVPTAFAVLFFGGMAIFPVGTAVVRLGFRRPGEQPGNPLGRIALESTIAMIAALVMAWLLLPYRPDWAFPLAAIAVGTHYFAFRSAYGDMLFWVLAAVVTAIGCLGVWPVVALPGGVIAWVAAVELGFGAVLTARALRA